MGTVQPQKRPAVGFQQTAPTGPNGAIKVTLQVKLTTLLVCKTLRQQHLCCSAILIASNVSHKGECGTLQDCLACSGCVTSAETILLEHQSAEEFVSKLGQPGTSVVVSISPQSRAALAAFYGLPPAECMSR